jgi:hypothetical protein
MNSLPMANRERYLIDQSPFFRLGSKRKLGELLGLTIKQLNDLARGTQYNVFKNDRGRWIQHPIGSLGAVHKRIAKLLIRIALPDYVHAQKGHSYVSNAKAHTGIVPVIKTDLTAYYPSVELTQVIRLFSDDFKCPPDVAWLIARICTYQGRHIPTGSEISGIVAFLATRKMFDEIHSLALKSSCKMTCYVDDIVLSGQGATKRLLVQVRQIAKKHGMKTKDSKSKTFAAHAPKTITGCVVSGDKLLLPNIRHEKINRLTRELNGTTDKNARAVLEASLRGRRLEAAQILS